MSTVRGDSNASPWAARRVARPGIARPLWAVVIAVLIAVAGAPAAASADPLGLSPMVPQHVPPLFADADQPANVSLSTTCPTASCEATLYYRTTPDSGVEPLVADLASLESEPGWGAVTMTPAGSTDLGELGKQLDFKGQIPASVVDTRGVDYAFKVSDGKRTAWSPGLPAAAEASGARLTFHHLHVVSPTRLLHVPTLTAPYRKSIPITGRANCSKTRQCTARLYWRTTTSSVLDTTAQFDSAPMTVTRDATYGNQDQIKVTGTIPASVADTRGVDYFFSVSDGSTEAWWPGTSRIDGYLVGLPGTRVAYSHIRVIDPPHILPTSLPLAIAYQPYKVNARITCVTESCGATLYYTCDSSTPLSGRIYTPVAMDRRPGPLTFLGGADSYSATVPEDCVTSRGVGYFIRADDGFVRTLSPGTSYFGSYLPMDGQRPGDLDLPVPLTANGIGVITDPTSPITIESHPKGLRISTNLDIAWPVRVITP